MAKTSENQEIRDLLAEPSGTRANPRSTRQWLESQPKAKRKQIEAVLGEFVAMRRAGETDWSWATLVKKVLRPRFRFPYSGEALSRFASERISPRG